MKTETVADIITAVKARIDELAVNESGSVLASDDPNLDAIIREVIGDAYRYVALNADSSLLETGPSASGQVTMTVSERQGMEGSYLVGVVRLPSNYLRGVSIRVSSWLRAANDFVSEDSAEYTMQWDPYARGTWQRPVAAVLNSGFTPEDAGRTVELFTLRSASDTLSGFYYVEDIGDTSEDTDTVAVPDDLYNGFIYYTCYLVLTALRDPSAPQFHRIANELIGNTYSNNSNETYTNQQ